MIIGDNQLSDNDNGLTYWTKWFIVYTNLTYTFINYMIFTNIVL